MKKAIFTFAVVVATTLNMVAQQVALGFSNVGPQSAIDVCNSSSEWVDVEEGYSDMLEMSYYNFGIVLSGKAYKVTYYDDGTLLFNDTNKKLVGSYELIEMQETNSDQVIGIFRNKWNDGGFKYIAMYVDANAGSYSYR